MASAQMRIVTSGGDMTHLGREAAMFVVLAALVFAPVALAQQPAAAQPQAGGFSDLITALKATPGCLGVDTARTSSGKQVIFAWFENKKAALAWYYSEAHRNAVRMLAPDAPPRTPMAGVPDDDTPVLAIASLTPMPPDAARGAQPPAGGMPFAVSQ